MHLSALGWSWYRDANLVPTSQLADDLATAPLGSVLIAIPPQSCAVMINLVCYTYAIVNSLHVIVGVYLNTH